MVDSIESRNGNAVVNRNGVDYPVFEDLQPDAEKALKVAIVGTWPTTIDDAPCADSSWTVWTCSNANQRIARSDRHFELHDIPSHEEKWKRDGVWKMLTEVGRLVLSAPHPSFPNAEIYPQQQILKQFGSRYFTSSIAWMIALAIHEGANEIGLFGVNMETHEEYEHQRPCCEYLLGVAVGLGINVTIPKACGLLKANRLYGYETNRSEAWLQLERREKELQAKMQETQAKLNTAQQDLNLIRGAIMETKYLKQFV